MASVLWLGATLGGLLVLFTWLGRRSHQRLLATVAVVTLPGVASTVLGNSRDLTVYLPRDYATDQHRAYPVLYLNDGQDRGELALHEALARLQARGEMQPALVVAVPTNADRLREYGTAVAPNAQGLGDRAAAFAAFMTDEVMPLIAERFRTCGRAVVLGASLGGLSAFDLAWNHPDRFGRVGVLSGSFWWRAKDEETAVMPGRRIAHEMVRRGARVNQRFWFEAGTRDETSDRDGNGVIDAIQDTTELIDELLALGYVAGQDVVYVEVAGGRHHYGTWAAVLPDFLRWALGPAAPLEGCRT
jgi:enterochelin esterase-like enzyme